MLRTILSAAALVMSVSTVYAAPRNPIGESADYQLDKHGSRTTSMVSKGSGKGSVNEYLPHTDQGPSYKVQVNYDLTMRFYGHKVGRFEYPLTEKYFDPEFIAQLRQTGHYETPDYKIRHEGFADAKNLDGGRYPNCDKIRFYDIKIHYFEGLEKLLMIAAGLNPDEQDLDDLAIEDLQIAGHVYPGIPALGSVKLDITGVIQGVRAKIGFDIKKP